MSCLLNIRKVLILLSLILSFFFSNANSPEEQNIQQPLIPLTSSVTTCTTHIQPSASIGFTEYFGNLLDNSRWPARWTCGDWAENEGWLYIFSDLSIFLAYLSIPIMLLWYIRKKRLGKMKWLVALFGSFILLCGLTHLIDVILFWDPMYRLSGFVKLITGVVSMGTAVVLGIVIPMALKYKSPAEMEEEIEHRKKLQDLFDLFLKSSPRSIAMLDSKLNYLMVNEKWNKDYNTQRVEVIGKSHYDLFPELHKMPERLKYYQDALSGQIIKKEKETIVINGRTETCRTELLPWYDTDGSIGGVIQMTEILTETEKLKEDLNNVKETARIQSETIFELSHLAQIGTWEYYIERNEVVWSDVVYDVHEVEKGTEISVEDAINYYHPDYREIISKVVEEAITKGKSWDVECILVTSSNKEIWVRAIGQAVIEDDKVVALKGLFQDINTLKQSEMVLSASNKSLEKKVKDRTKELEDTIDHLQTTQNQLIESEKLASLGQISAGVAHEINTPLGAINASIGSLQDSFWKSLELLKNLQSVLGEEEVKMLFSLLKEGAKQKERLSTREERALRKELMNTLDSWDVENSRGLADRLVVMNVRDELDAFKDLILHNDSEHILDLAYHLNNESNAAKNIELAVQKASKTVFALKSYSRFEESHEVEEVDICQNIETVLVLYHNQIKRGINVTKVFPDQKVMVHCQPDRLIQVWTNLIHNAMQAMEYSGELEIIIEEDKEEVIIAIKDSGPGIPPKIQPQIFKTFFTTKPAGEGSGLGLDIVKKIVKKHKGLIWFETSELGTKFFIKLPKQISK
ncbi:ATP-binding protein [Ekhidna sp.]